MSSVDNAVDNLTIVFYTAWHFASASGLKFAHDDQNKDNGSSILMEFATNKHKPNITMTNRIQCVSKTV